MKEGEILVRLPITGRITVSAVGKGKSKIRAVEMYEQISSRFQNAFKRWYEMQLADFPFKVDEPRAMAFLSAMRKRGESEQHRT